MPRRSAAASAAPSRRRRAASSGAADALAAAAARAPRARGVSGSSGGRDRRRVELARIEALDAVGVEHEQRVERVEMLDQRSGRRRSSAVDAADDRLARRRRRRTRPAARWVQTSGPGTSAPAELLEDEHRVGVPRPTPPSLLRQAQREDAELGELAARAPRSKPPRFSSSRTPRSGSGPSQNERTPCLQRHLVVGSSRKSTLSAPSACRGCARPTMLRWICEVPAAIVSESECSRLPDTCWFGEPAEVVARETRRGRGGACRARRCAGSARCSRA